MKLMVLNRTYTELSKIDTFKGRFDYLRLDGEVGHSTFGFDRHINQSFYHSAAWRRVRDYVILRDAGCDLGVPGYEIHAEILIHHLNPIVVEDIIHGEEWIIDPEFLITTTKTTHNAIHFGDSTLLPTVVTERQPGDTKLW